MAADSRENLIKTISHRQPAGIVFDIGATNVSNISASTLYKLRIALGLKPEPVKLCDPYQGLGLVEEDVREIIGVDVAGITSLYTAFGYKNQNWKPWKLPDGTDVLVGGDFTVKKDENANTLIFPGSDTGCSPCAKMPKNGFYFDPVNRQQKINENLLNGKLDFKDDFVLFSDEELKYFEKQSLHLYNNTSCGIAGHMELMPAGDLGLIFGTHLKNPRGIRNMEEWLISHYTRSGYIKEVLDYGSQVALKNLELYRQAVSDRIQVIPITGNDFGNQNGLIYSPDIYRQVYKPFYKRVNDWVHKNTKWKTFFHSCGAITAILDDMIDSGVDIINPVQTSANGMDPKALKEKYGDKIVFWGGGVEPLTLQFGTAEEVKQQALERIKIFSPGGGFVFGAIHNIQPNVPVENVLALIEAVRYAKNSNISTSQVIK